MKRDAAWLTKVGFEAFLFFYSELKSVRFPDIPGQMCKGVYTCSACLFTGMVNIAKNMEIDKTVCLQ